jgi:glycosyltransferase involved in cell wall biosynthesis
MRKMLHLRVVAGTGGGPEKTILNSPRFIRKYGYDAEVVYLASAGEEIARSLKARAQESDCPLTVLEDHGPTDWRIVRQLYGICRDRKIELFQAHDYKSNAIGLVLRRLHRMKMVTMLHGWTDMSGRMPLYKRIDQWCLPWYKTLICVSQDLVEECQRLRIPDARIHLVHNAIDTIQFARSRSVEEAKRELGVPPDAYLIGTVGRLSPEKGILSFLEVIHRLHQEGRSCMLWIAGDGPQRSEIEGKIASLGLGNSVRLLGQIRDTKGFYEAMDLFVLNSIREGLPNVVLEAMALEVPVVATNIAGIPSLIRPGDTGLLIEPNDSPALFAAIKECMDFRPRCEAFARAARALIESEYSFENRMQRIASIYDSLFL